MYTLPYLPPVIRRAHPFPKLEIHLNMQCAFGEAFFDN